MGSLMQDFKRQASFFLREKIKTARLVLTDVTPIQLLTEEITNGDSLAPDVHAMRLISRAAFEVDDYDRVVQILHHRLSKFERWNWRASYKALVVLEHLLTHGPQRTAEEFECDEDTIQEMTNFQYVDDKGFNWGLSVKNKSERVLNLLQDSSYLKEERERARKLIVGIKGFGSFSHKPTNERSNEENSDKILRSNSLFCETHHHHDDDRSTKSNFLGSDEYSKLLVTNKIGEADDEHWSNKNVRNVVEEDHPSWNREHNSRVSLLSSV